MLGDGEPGLVLGEGCRGGGHTPRDLRGVNAQALGTLPRSADRHAAGHQADRQRRGHGGQADPAREERAPGTASG